MADLYVHRDWCEEHCDTHLVDERGQCHGATLADVESSGYSWPRHIGGGWYRLHERHPQPLPLEWQMMDEALAAQDVEEDF